MNPPTHVVGFLFSADLSTVVLIKKARPTWQRGRLNGVGGKIEPGETSITAMEREFAEETGYKGEIIWRKFCTYDCPSHGTVMDFFCAKDEQAVRGAHTVTDEMIYFLDIDELLFCDQSDVIVNLLWLVPMAANFLRGSETATFEVVEKGESHGLEDD